MVIGIHWCQWETSCGLCSYARVCLARLPQDGHDIIQMLHEAHQRVRQLFFLLL